MATKKIEVNEDDIKKVIFILKQSKPYLQIPSENLALRNLWQSSEKLADKFMKKAGLVMVTLKGRTLVKPAEASVEKVEAPVEEKPIEEKPAEVEPAPVTEETTSVEESPETKVPRCRKRKPK